MAVDSFYDKYVSTRQIDRIAAYSNTNVYYDYIIKEHLATLSKDSLVVDLGCGYGELLHRLKQDGFKKVAGVDISGELIDIAHSLGTKEAVLMDIEEYLSMLDDSSVHVFVAKDIFEHLEINMLNRVLERCRRKLVRGGFIIGHVPNGEGIYGMKIFFGDMTHKLAFTRKSLQQVAMLNGFSHVACYEDTFFGKGIKSTLRLVAWKVLTFHRRVLHWVESGSFSILLSQNITFKAMK